VKTVSATMKLLFSLGFIINNRKSVLTPTKACRFLGFMFDTKHFAISIPPNRRSNLLHMTLDMLNRDHCKIRLLASYIGSLISMSNGPVWHATPRFWKGKSS